MRVEATFGSLKIGQDHPVRLMGVINVSPESFYKGSVYLESDKIAEAAEKMKKEGAEIIDVGAMSTAPYLKTEIPVTEESKRLTSAIRAIKETSKILVSADTTRSIVAQRACEAGADILNDVTGFKADPRMPVIAEEYGVGMVLMAHEGKPSKGSPLERIISCLAESLEIAGQHEINPKKIIVDPGVGFFRKSPWPWYLWDAFVLKNLQELKSLGHPVIVAVSRKSFIGEILKQRRPEDRLYGSLSATAIAVLNGASAIRAHEVAPTREVVQLAEFIRKVKLPLN